MGQILHKRATTTYAVRAAIQQSQESIRTLAERYNINHKTVLKWKHRDTVSDFKMGKKHICSTVLTATEEEMIVRIRVLTQLSLDDLFVVLLDTIPHLKRTTLYNCLRRHGVQTLPKEEKERKKQEFKEYKIGYFHIDTAEIKTAEGKAYLFVAIDRTSKFTLARLYLNKTIQSASDFINYVIQTVPYVIEKILTDNGMEYTDMITHKGKPTGAHAFDQLCSKHSIEHRLTQVKHPWTNGQVERMNRTLKDNTVKKYHYSTFDSLNQHIQDFLRAYNCAKKLKALGYKTPLEYLNDLFLNTPIRFKRNPFLYYLEPYTYLHFKLAGGGRPLVGTEGLYKEVDGIVAPAAAALVAARVAAATSGLDADPKRPGSEFTEAEYALAKGLLMESHGSKEAFLMRFGEYFSPERAEALFLEYGRRTEGGAFAAAAAASSSPS